MFEEISKLLLLFIAVFFTWTLNNLGGAIVFLFPNTNKRVFDLLLGFSSGIMLASSFFSLLLPSIDISHYFNIPSWLVVGISFLVGGAFLKFFDTVIPHLHIGTSNVEGINSDKFNKAVLLFLSMSLHNIPEGFAVGVSVGATSLIPGFSGLSVALGIGIQNIPEGLAISSALFSIGTSKFKSFWYSVLSGFAEVIGGFIGFFLIVFIPQSLPIFMSIAAGAMIYIVIEELIPESQLSGNSDISTLGAMVGFVIMMALDTIKL